MIRTILIFLFLCLTASVFAEQIVNDTDDVSLYFLVKTGTGAIKTDVTVTDIDIYYTEYQAAQATKADATALAAADSAHTDNAAYHVGNGLYRVDLPDAAFDGGIGTNVQCQIVWDAVSGYSEVIVVELIASPATAAALAAAQTDLDTITDTGIALTAAGIDAIFANVAEGTFTFKDVVRIAGAFMAGNLTIVDGVYTFTGLDGVTVRIQSTVVDGAGRTMTIVSGD